MASFPELSKHNDTKVFSTVNETDRTNTPVSPCVITGELSPAVVTGESPTRVHNGKNISDMEV